jgi:VWFA-related protein
VADSAGPAGGKTAGAGELTIDELLALHHVHTEEVRLVLLPTSVTDRKGRIVRGLESTDFRLFEDSVPQEIRFVSAESREPISIAFMLDVSGSMRRMDKLWHAKQAIRYFVDELQPGDSFGLICFADEQVVWVTEFTEDREWFLRRLEVQRGYGQTALHDAVAAAPALVDGGTDGRKALVLITDGFDNHSRLTLDQAIDVARRVNLPIFTIGFLSVAPRHLPKDSQPANLEILRHVSEETGGRLFAVHEPAELKEAVVALEEELRFQYVIGYYPTRKEPDNRFRSVQLEALNTRLQVHTRSGYYATP